MSAAPIGMAVCRLLRDAGGRVVDWRWIRGNPTIERLTGLTTPSGLPASETPGNLPASRPDLVAISERVAGCGQPEAVRVAMPDGRWMAVHVFPLEEADVLGVLVDDVTDDHEVRAALAASERLYRGVVNSLAEGVVVQDATGRIVSWNPAALRILGITEAQISGSSSYDPRWGAIWPDGRPAPGNEHPASRVRATGVAEHGVVMGVRHADGEVRWTRLDADPLWDVNGALAGVAISFADVTERLTAERRAASAEDQRERTQQQAGIGSWMFAVATGRVWWSSETFRIHDIPPGESEPDEVTAALDFYEPADRERLDAAFRGALEDGIPYDLELDLRTAVGRSKRVRTTGQADFQDGRIVGVFGHIQDVTAQHRSSESARVAQERLARIMDANIVGLAFARADGSFAMANDYYLALVGATREDLEAGRVDWRKVTPPEWIQADETALQELLERGACTPYEKEYVHPDGRRVPVFIADALMPGPDALIAAIVLDISDRKRAERAVQQLNADLEARVAARTHALEEANRELESFSYSVSHDLRAPLRAIDAFGGILADEQAAALDDEGRRVLGVIRRNAQQMGVLIDDLLAFSRAGRRELEHRHVDMESVVHSVIDELEAGTPGCAQVIDVGPLPAVRGDAVLLRQVWQNLIANAVKFSAPVPVPRIEVRCRVGPEVGLGHFTVTDNGVGYDPAYADKLFQPFQRLHPAAQFEGSGIGLAIVRRAVTRHGGDVSTEGRPGRGAVFGFTLPLEEMP